jgi:hypothetical protein
MGDRDAAARRPARQTVVPPACESTRSRVRLALSAERCQPLPVISVATDHGHDTFAEGFMLDSIVWCCRSSSARA